MLFKYFNLVVLLLINLAIIHCQIHNKQASLVESAKKQECRYEKSNWSDCDLTSGQQKRTLKLKISGRSNPDNCEPIKEVVRACKKVCRYNKGTWSECINGERTRTDTLKSAASSSGCEPSRVVPKKCKPTCRYSKGDWSACENGEKKRTLTRLEGDGPDCEPTKVISKQCSPQGKKSKQARQKNRKSNSSPSGMGDQDEGDQ